MLDSLLAEVNSIAHKLSKRTRQLSRAEDFAQAGLIGVLKAHERYDPSRGIPWITFAKRAAHYAMLDEIRRFDTCKRGARSKGLAYVLEPLCDQVVVDHKRRVDHAETFDFFAFLRKEYGRKGLIISLRYQHEISFVDIGRRLGLCESRIWQLHEEMLDVLRVLLKSA